MNFEEAMKRKDELSQRREDSDVLSSSLTIKRDRYRSDKGATLHDFIKMLDLIVELSMPEVDFIPDEGKVYSLDAMNNFDRPVITYQVIRRRPKMEIKPRQREIIEERTSDNNTIRNAEIWGQKFECLVQFNIFASVYKEAEQVMENFEEVITKHAGFFKRNGVAELLFNEHITDSHFDTLRESLSIRSLRYYVEIEKLTVMLKEKINEIELLAQQRKDEEEI